MIVNPDKFQVILPGKRGSNDTNIKVKIGNKKINRLRQFNLSEYILTIN